jgi:hypothetical protein
MSTPAFGRPDAWHGKQEAVKIACTAAYFPVGAAAAVVPVVVVVVVAPESGAAFGPPVVVWVVVDEEESSALLLHPMAKITTAIAARPKENLIWGCLHGMAQICAFRANSIFTL